MTAALSAYQHVVVGYLATGALLGAFVWRVVHRGRSLARRVPDSDKPWI